MVETAGSLRDIVSRYRAELEHMGIHAERILLYGSYARHVADEGSDIDLVVISSDWASYELRERLEMLGIAAARILEPVQAYGVTPEEIVNRRLSPFWQHILEEQAVAV